MSCICEKDNNSGPFYPLNKKRIITYTDLYYQYSENGGPNISKEVTENASLYLRVSYPYAWETNKSGKYMRRIFSCPLCGRIFPPQTPHEEMIFGKGKNINVK